MERPHSVTLLQRQLDVLGKKRNKLPVPVNQAKEINDYLYDLEQRVEALQKENTCLSLFK